MATAPLFSVTGLDVFYGEARALEDVSLEVMPGEIVTVVGANGAGKTTLLRTISGLLRPRRGEIRFVDRPIHRDSPERIVAMGLVHVPEGRRLWPRMTVDEHLDLAGRIGGQDQKDARRRRVFDLFPRLSERRHQEAGTMSGGEQQMLALGRAHMLGPRLLLLDEPSLGLAPRLVTELFARLREVNAEGISMLLVEQNVKMAMRLSARTYVLELGRIVAAGPSGKLAEDRSFARLYLGLSE
jgi:branched-chain amino acid transport system ATP-binding protein